MKSLSTEPTPGSRSSRRGSGLRALTAGLVAAGMLGAPVLANADVVAGPSAKLAAVSPDLGAGNLPTWYRDSTGVSLAPCDDSPTFCAIDPTGLEVFYQLALSDVTLNSGDVFSTEFALEANTGNTAADSAVFGRIRFRSDLPANAPLGTYTIVHPYGVDTIDVTSTGRRAINYTDDVGLAPGSFTAALGSRINPFLMPVYDAAHPDPAGAYIADPNLTYQVTGSALNDAAGLPTNYVKIIDPNGVEIGRSNQFTLNGKLFDATAPVARTGASGTAAVGSVATLDGSTSLNATSYAWTQTNGTDVTLTGANTAQPSFTVPDVAKALEFQLTVTNGTTSSTSLVSITPTPTADVSAPGTAVFGTPVTLVGGLSKAAASYQWTQVSNGSPTVSLTGANTTQASFIMPNSTVPLVFQLTTKNGSYSAIGTTVVVPVAPVVVSTVPVATVVAPSAVRSLSVAPGNGKVTVKWAAPANKGNGTFAGYAVLYRATGAKAWSTARTNGLSLALGVRNDVRYEFRVHARSSNGNGPVSGAVSTVASRKPHGPRAVKATPVVRGVKLTWAAPAYRGASPIRSYVVQYRTPGKAWVTAGTTTRGTFTKAGLRRGAKFEFRVLARNSYGTGYASAVVSARTK